MVKTVYPPFSPHKFCWFSHKPEEYQSLLAGHTVTGAKGFGIFCDLKFDGGIHPKRKMGDLTDWERDSMFQSVKAVLGKMMEQRGPDTEKDLFGNRFI